MTHAPDPEPGRSTPTSRPRNRSATARSERAESHLADPLEAVAFEPGRTVLTLGPLRARPSRLAVDRVNPCTRCPVDVGPTRRQTLDVSLEHEVAATPLVRHLLAIASGQDSPGLVAETTDGLVANRAGLPGPAVCELAVRPHRRVRVCWGAEPLHDKVGQLGLVFPPTPCGSDQVESSELAVQLRRQWVVRRRRVPASVLRVGAGRCRRLRPVPAWRHRRNNRGPCDDILIREGPRIRAPTATGRDRDDHQSNTKSRHLPCAPARALASGAACTAHGGVAQAHLLIIRRMSTSFGHTPRRSTDIPARWR